jgi:cleavage stimulation factor subunit 3
MELENEDFYRVEQIFNKALLSIPNVQLWSMYLDYVRRRNNLTTDSTGNARQVISQAYEFVLQNIGNDKDSGFIWQDYVRFIRSGPGNVGGNTWQDQQKMDTLRKAFRQAIMIPTQAVHSLWQEYYAFEMGLNKVTGRKFLHEKMPSYMTAKQSCVQLQNITKHLNRTTLPRLPPAIGFDGDVEHQEQVEIWKKWIQWEKEDPLVLKEEDLTAYKKRVVYVFKQATITMRFEPEFWYDAAIFCSEIDMDAEGREFLEHGIAANPESCLLAFKRADRIEMSTVAEEGQDAVKRRGDAIREPYDNVLNALYELIIKTQVREEKSIARLQEAFAQQESNQTEGDSDGEEDQILSKLKAKEAALEAQTKAIQSGSNAQIELLKKTLSFAWIALMRAMRRVQGKGKPGDVIGGSRQIFSDARKTGRLTSDVYVASALIEHHCYKDPAATKIFERGMRLFPEDENFALEYLKHLIDINDATSKSKSSDSRHSAAYFQTDARAVFETIVNRLTQKPENVVRAKPLYLFFHSYESKYGELSQIAKLEKRMADLFPEDSRLTRFAHRYQHTNLQNQRFDPTAIRPMISLAAQAKPKSLHPSIEKQPSSDIDTPVAPFSPQPQNSPRPGLAVPDHQPYISPKRPYVQDITDDAQSRNKVPRGDSPLKGAAGRRLDAAKRRGEGGNQVSNVGPPALPRDVTFFLSILPRADLSGHLPKPSVPALMQILSVVNMRGGGQQAAGMQRQSSGQGYGAPQQHQQQYGYPTR